MGLFPHDTRQRSSRITNSFIFYLSFLGGNLDKSDTERLCLFLSKLHFILRSHEVHDGTERSGWKAIHRADLVILFWFVIFFGLVFIGHFL